MVEEEVASEEEVDELGTEEDEEATEEDIEVVETMEEEVFMIKGDHMTRGGMEDHRTCQGDQILSETSTRD